MWIAFTRDTRSYPCAIKIAAGKVSAVSGKPWNARLDTADGDYVVVPPQPWLDGFCVAKDVVRQFVAMPLGAGYSIEEQLTGRAENGGLQLVIYPMKAVSYPAIVRQRTRGGDPPRGGGRRAVWRRGRDRSGCTVPPPRPASAALAAGTNRAAGPSNVDSALGAGRRGRCRLPPADA